VQPPQPALVATAIVPDYALGAAHRVAGPSVRRVADRPARAYAGEGMFIGQHGSWNRAPHSGYKVIFVPFQAGRPAGMPIDVLTGFLKADGKAQGRPVGVAIDRRGGLLVADDVGNAVWRVGSAP
jgi:glucose/arabinose dehydrogenase